VKPLKGKPMKQLLDCICLLAWAWLYASYFTVSCILSNLLSEGSNSSKVVCVVSRAAVADCDLLMSFA
jgi:hypothetical protein